MRSCCTVWAILLVATSAFSLPRDARSAPDSQPVQPQAAQPAQPVPDQKPAAAPQPEPVPPSPFARGRIRINFGAGGGVYDESSFISVALGAGYFVVSGLELGVDVTQWFGSDPNVTQVSPQIRYVVHQLGQFYPYIGAFYRHWFFWEGESDFDAIGARLGLYFALSMRAYVGIGGAYEAIVSSCDTDCSAIYPEVAFTISF